MAFSPEELLEAGERPIERIEVGFKKGHDPKALRLLLTDRRLFHPGMKTFAIADAVTTEAMPVSAIEAVEFRMPSALWRWGLALGLAIVGAATTFGPVSIDGDLRLSVFSAGLVVSPLVPWLARSKRILVVRGVGRSFRWASPIVVGVVDNTKLTDLEGALRRWCAAVGVRFEADDR